jgi:tRNA dimethylallyltransferase
MAAARAVPGTEIVAVDAMQVYRGMDIGTAKPSRADRAAVPHHGLDLVDLDAEMTVAAFRRAYDGALADIARRGGRALVVAGTGLYLTAVLDRLDLPGRWPSVRSEVEAEPDTWALYGRLRELDAVAAARMEPGNRRRIVRALEVTIGAGRPFSSFGRGVAEHPALTVPQIGIRWPRDALVRRIDDRVTAMVAAGLVNEARRVHGAGMSRSAAQALGYKELVDHLKGRASLEEAIAAISTRTRQFAVRQERWFRRDGRIRWIGVDPTAADPLAPVRAAVIEELTRR